MALLVESIFHTNAKPQMARKSTARQIYGIRNNNIIGFLKLYLERKRWGTRKNKKEELDERERTQKKS